MRYDGKVFGDIFHEGFATEWGSASSAALEAMSWPYVAREGVRRELRQDGVCPVDTTLDLAHGGWVQHEKKSAALLSQCTLRKETGGGSGSPRVAHIYKHRALL